MVEIPVELELERLALDQLGVGPCQNLDCCLAQGCGRNLGSSRHQEIPSEDGNRVAPVRVCRRGPAPGGCLVDHIIVIEAPYMDQLDGHRCIDRAHVIGRAEFGGELGEERSESLSAGHE